MKTGLVSISFRNLSPEEIIDACVKCALVGIEWGGDVHVPLCDTKRALQVGRMTRNAGLEISAYGSYVHMTKPERGRFSALTDTARALGADYVRIWAGESETEGFEEVIESAQILCDSAKDLKFGFEFHAGTLTHDARRAKSLIEGINRPNIYCGWQPNVGEDMEECLAGLNVILPYIGNLHVFSWDGTERLALSAHEARWKKYLATAQAATCACLEFVKGDSLEQLFSDAETLKKLISELNT